MRSGPLRSILLASVSYKALAIGTVGFYLYPLGGQP
jgi:hypothetical protein